MGVWEVVFVGLVGVQILVGMPSHFRSCLGSVWSAMVLTSECTGLLIVYRRL